MKYRNTLTISIIIVIIIAVFSGCGNGSITSKDDVKFLTSAEYWWHYDETTGENEKMHFGEDASFSWGCECGEPIGYSDVLELYEYDSEAQIIRLYNDFDDTSMELKVLDYSDYHILLEIDGVIKDYTSMDSMYGEVRLDNAEELLGGYNMHSWFMESDGTNVIVGPYNYDGDVDYPDNAFKSYKLAEDIEFYNLYVETVLDVESETEITKAKHTPMSYDEGITGLDSGYGFIWFNDAMEIEKVTFYGSVYIQE